ncbi:DNA adenine methylase [Candidatus Kuenenia stuttgartiensis]|uniref:site-specific DNA-methyltransferase (adenine-specific) n=1 Tax=Kuenenia stuttgartiensis TaxID=174633 RepID=A0A2C9CB60_KUEST|nr:DNA adenine methylase [Candidatus Kuenenia stuttgartiensis]SOH02808.1 DNA adenine methylase [Candidatus Kuenenia stuttgartiensis]
MLRTAKSPVNRIGGKYQLTGWLSKYMPGHVCYVEPFAGAGHLLFSKRPSPVEVLNDIDGNLISFFRVIKDTEKRQKLIETLENMPYARSLWQDIRTRWKAGDLPGDAIERAAWWFYLNRVTYGGDMQTGGFAMPSITGRNPAQSYCNTIDSLEHVAGRLRGVTIECLSYDEVVRRYDSPDSFFYVDPPYLNAEGYYGDSFTENDHYRLSELLHGIKGKAMISHYQNSLYESLYADFNRHEYQSFKGSHKSAGEKKPVTVECLYMNFKPAVNRSLFDAME